MAGLSLADQTPDYLKQLAATPDGMSALVAERDRRQNDLAAQNAAAQANHERRLAEMSATGRAINPNYTNPTTGVANLAADDAAWQSGAGLERIARMEYDLAPGVRQMNAAQLREFVEGGGAAAWRASELARNPAPANDPFGGARAPTFEDQLGYGTPAPGGASSTPRPGSTPPATSPTGTAPTPTATTAGGSPSPAAYGGATVAERLESLLKADNPLIRQARSQGLAAGNRRGLLNSSMAAGAAQGEAYKVALPIAQQDAAQAHQTNLANADIAAQMDRLRAQAGFNTDAQVRDLQAQFERLRYSSDADDQRQARDIAAQLERLGIAGSQQIGAIQAQGQVQSGLAQQQFGFQQQLNAQAAELDSRRIALQGNIQSALQAQGAQQQQALEQIRGTIQSALQSQASNEQLERMGAEFAHQRSINTENNAAQMERLLASGDQELGRLAAVHQNEMERLQAQIAAGDRQAIAQATINIFSAEAAMRQALLANTTMPAAERAAYEQAIAALGDPVRAFINQLYTPPTGLNAGGVLTPSPPPAVSPPPAGIAPPTTPIAAVTPVGSTTTTSAPGLDPYGLWGGPNYQRLEP